MASSVEDVKRKKRRDAYTAGINRAIDYIDTHLESELSLEKIASKAGFSKFHFHRLFGALTGETLNRFVQRLRVERAASKLKTNLGESITDVALSCGFSSSAAFARVFKEYFGMSAGRWREMGFPEDSKIGKTFRKMSETMRNNRKDHRVSPCHFGDVTNNPKWRIEMVDTNKTISVKVEELPGLDVVYIRHVGPYAGDSKLFEGLIGRLMAWAGPRGLVRFPETQMLSAYHDDPNITDEDKLRVSMCITVPEGTKGDGEVGTMRIPKGKYAVANCEIVNADDYGEYWQALMCSWMPESGYQPADGLCYELYKNDPNQHPEGHHIIEICFPVKPL